MWVRTDTVTNVNRGDLAVIWKSFPVPVPVNKSWSNANFTDPADSKTLKEDLARISVRFDQIFLATKNNAAFTIDRQWGQEPQHHQIYQILSVSFFQQKQLVYKFKSHISKAWRNQAIKSGGTDGKPLKKATVLFLQSGKVIYLFSFYP